MSLSHIFEQKITQCPFIVGTEFLCKFALNASSCGLSFTLSTCPFTKDNIVEGGVGG